MNHWTDMMNAQMFEEERLAKRTNPLLSRILMPRPGDVAPNDALDRHPVENLRSAPKLLEGRLIRLAWRRGVFSEHELLLALLAPKLEWGYGRINTKGGFCCTNHTHQGGIPIEALRQFRFHRADSSCHLVSTVVSLEWDRRFFRRCVQRLFRRGKLVLWD